MSLAALVNNVSLHRVRFPKSVENNSKNSSFICADLEPIVVLTENNNNNNICSSSNNNISEGCGLIECYSSLKTLLGCFCGPLLKKQSELALQGHISSKFDMYWINTTSPISADGLYIQVPSCKFISECLRCAVNGTVMDMIYYNSLSSRWWKENNSSVTNSENQSNCDNFIDVYDEGYIYGFAQFISIGNPNEGLLLTAFSTSPLFNMLRTIVLETVPHIIRTSRDVYADSHKTWQVEQLRTIAAVYNEVLSPLSDLLDARSSICSTPANKFFNLNISNSKISIIRPDDLRCPFINTPLSTLFLSFSYDALRVIYSLLLQEKRIVFIGATPQHASACVISVQAMLVPFLWTLPIIPYMPAEAYDVLTILGGGGGFILGATADLIPHLMLYSGQANTSSFSSSSFPSSPQRRNPVNSTMGEVENEDDNKYRIWFADARTGVVGVAPRDTDRVPFITLDLVPPSEKVKEAIKRAVSKEQRHMFHISLASTVAHLLGDLPSRSSTLIPCPPAAMVDEVHGAFLEYNVHRLVGNYRKGLLPLGGCNNNNNNNNNNNCSISNNIYSNNIINNNNSGNRSSRLQGIAAYTIDYTRFLPGNLENNSILARNIAGTRMFHHWEDTVLSLETIGVMRSLLGEFVRSRVRSCQRGSSSSSSLRGRETLAMHYYLSHPRMIGMLCFFYIRSTRRYPELYNDLQVSELIRLIEDADVNYKGNNQSFNNNMITNTGSSTGFSGGIGGSNSSNNNGKGLMRTLFSKATKAVKNSLSTHYYRIPVQAFIQAYGSFSNKTSYEKDPSKPATLNKEFKSSTAAVAATSYGSNQQQDQSIIPSMSLVSSACDTEDELYGAYTNLFSEMEDSEPFPRITPNSNESITSIVCRRLPLDIIHQFGRYHSLLDPTKETVYLTGRRSDTRGNPSREELEILMNFGKLFASEPSIWPILESKREYLLQISQLESKTPSTSLSFPSQHKEEKQEQIQKSSHIESFDESQFQAQPLPFSMDLVTRAPELPPLPNVFQSPTNTHTIPPAPPLSFSQEFGQSPVALSGAPTPGSFQNLTVSNGNNIAMDELFAFVAPQSGSQLSGGDKKKELEDFFQ